MFPFLENSVSLAPLDMGEEQFQHSMLEELKESGLEGLAKDSGLLTEQGLVTASLKRDSPDEEDEFEKKVDQDSVSMSPVKKGRTRGKSASGRRGKRKSGGNYSSNNSNNNSGKNGQASNNPKGLRHFALAVCNKVKEKGMTTYNEVADELVQEFESQDGRADEKNIRRRVYDALNVLSAMDIIRKDKKDIIWKGLPANVSAEVKELKEEMDSRCERIAKKEEHLMELSNQLYLYKTLIERNANQPAPADERLSLPFIIVNTEAKSRIELRVSADRTDYSFDFNHPFEIHDDPEILMKILFKDNKEEKRGGAFGFE